MSKRKICVVTGTRADYGLLQTLMKEVSDDPALVLQVVATGMHLSPEYGLTYKSIEEDGFKISAKVEMLLSGDTPVSIGKSIGLAVIGFADAFSCLQPDIVVFLGDRYEILAAAQAALVARIPVAHIAGGDVTEGAFDESIRHSLTKMSHIHFVTNEDSARRVRQLGENPEYIFNVGSPGLDVIRSLRLLNRSELETALDFKFKEKNLLVTYHPVTLENQTSAKQFQELLSALDKLGENMGIIFTKPNSDTDSRIIIRMIDDFVALRSHAKAYVSLGQLRYLSAMSQVDVVVGNSSSGLYEAPSFSKATVNIGDRQKGRLKAASVLDCLPVADEIRATIEQACSMDCSSVKNPYGDGYSSERIKNILKKIVDPRSLLKKHFFEDKK